MNWYLQNGRDSDVTLYSKIILIRNLREFKFNLQNEKDIEKLKNKIKDNINSIGYGLKYFELNNMDDITKESLIEKNIITSDYVKNNPNGAIVINDEENICIVINDEEHLKIEFFSSGFELENLLNFIIELDEKIGEIFQYATNKKYGYLTSSPTNCGTGLNASVILHVPGLNKTNNIENVIYNLNNFSISIRKKQDEIEDILEVSNKITLGITEKEIIENMKFVINELIKKERQARKFLTKNLINLEDSIYRSYGILENCKKITFVECQELISNLKIGIDLGIIKEINDSKIRKLCLYTKKANMQKYYGEKFKDLELDVKRANIIKEILKER